MKISHNKVGQNVNISDSTRSERNQKTKSEGSSVSEFMAPQSGVNLDLSDRARDIKQIKELATAAPDVDEVKVAKFKKLIADGQYKVDSQALAEKMLNEYKEE